MTRRRTEFVPVLPTLWPSMLIEGARDVSGFQPFAASRVRYFYFARNAVWLTVKMLGLENAEVLVPAYHHGVEIEALIDAGALVRFYRVGSRWDVDLADVERKISERTRALYLTHYAGFPGPAAEMKRIADQHGLALIEDCALSLLSSDGAVPLGTTGDVAIFCLYKALPVPNGGALVANGARLASLPQPGAPSPRNSTLSHTLGSLLQNLELRAGAIGRSVRGAIRSVGRSTVSALGVERVATGSQHFEREHVGLGISALSLKIARAQDLRRIVERRRRNYGSLHEQLSEIAPPLFDALPAGACPLFYPLLVDDKPSLMARLRARGIETIDFWRDFHPACDPRLFPEVASLRRRVLEIPCHQDLDPERMATVAQAVRDALV